MKIFECVVKFGEELIKLLKSGYVLIRNLDASIFCSPDERNTVRIHFGDANDRTNIFGQRFYERTTVDSVNICTNFLKCMHKNWKEHMRVKRRNFGQLAFFRSDTIVTLQTQVAKIKANQQKYDSKQIESDMSMLLHNLHKNVSMPLLKQAIEYARQTMLDNEGRVSFAFKVELKLLGMGFSRKGILKALMEVKSNDFNDYKKFCIKFEQEEIGRILRRNLQDRNQSVPQAELHSPLNQYDSSAQVEERRTEYLDSQFYRLEDQFVEQFEKDFDNLVCIEFLGNMLKFIQDKSKASTPIEPRACPQYCKTEEPNLLLCPKDQIVSTVLSFYMVSSGQPLPTNDEIIFCTSRTTSEDLELFWTRVFKSRTNDTDTDQKLYCLANVQEVPPDQAIKTQDTLDRLLFDYMSTGKYERKPLKLCVVCSRDDLHRSPIAMTFGKYTRELPNPPSHAQLSQYMFSHYKSSKPDNTPASVERDNLKVRIITSDRAGCGKSLYIKKLFDLAKAETKNQVEYVCIPIKEKSLPFEHVFEKLTETRKSLKPKIVHIDISHACLDNVDSFLVDLLFVNYLCDSNGNVFRRSEQDLYLIEMTPYKFEKSSEKLVQNTQTGQDFFVSLSKDISKKTSVHTILPALPTLQCLKTSDIQHLLGASIPTELKEKIIPIDWIKELLEKEEIQRSCKYLLLYKENRSSEEFFSFRFSNERRQNSKTCLDLLLKFTREKRDDPTWRELTNFASFLNIQLKGLENWCAHQDDSRVSTFKKFFVDLIIQMAIELALPSKKISDQSYQTGISQRNNEAEETKNKTNEENKWEMTAPILLFDPDGRSFKIFGVSFDQSNKLVNSKTGDVVPGSEDPTLIKSKSSVNF